MTTLTVPEEGTTTTAGCPTGPPATGIHCIVRCEDPNTTDLSCITSTSVPVFTAEPAPIVPEPSLVTATTTEEAHRPSLPEEMPQTGFDAAPVLWAVLLVVIVGAMLLAIARRMRRAR